MTEIIKGYKAFNKDLTCLDFQYEIGETYEMDCEPMPCNRGFHYCPIAKDVLDYYPATSRFCEVEDLGQTKRHDDKNCTNKIKIVRELSREEMIELCGFEKNNLGRDNFGHSNTGHRNTGDRNTGHSNTGDWNTGHSNTGDWNKADLQAGFFNTKTPVNVDVFNKKCSKKKWNEAQKPGFIFRVLPNIWVSWDDMTDQEKIDHECAYTQYGYLKSISMEEAWAEAFKTATERDIELLKALPNYDYAVFKEITGIEDARLESEGGNE